MADSDRVEIAGSRRELVPNHSRIGDVDLTEEITVTVYLRPRADTGWVDQEAQLAPAERSHISREAWAERFGADPQDVEAVRALADAHQLTVTGVDVARRAVTLSGFALTEKRPVVALSGARLAPAVWRVFLGDALEICP